MSTRPKRHKRANGALAALAESLDLSSRHTSALLARGMPEDPDEARAWREAQPTGDASDSSERLRLARIRLCDEHRRRAEIQNDQALGELVSRGSVESSCLAITACTKVALLNLQNTLPGMLVGLASEPEIQRILRREFYDILQRLSDGEFFQAPAVLKIIESFNTDPKL